MNTYNLKNIIMVMYLLVPLLFYGVPYLYFFHQGGMNLNFFGSQFIESSNVLQMLIGHLFIGVLVCIFLLNRSFMLSVKEEKTVLNDVLLVFSFGLTYFIPFGIVSMISYPWFLFLFVSRRHYVISMILLLIISIFLVFFHEVRYPFVQVVILLLLPLLSRLSVFRLLMLAITALLFMAFILQPLRSGMIPFVETSDELVYLFQHLQPIYLGANTSLNINLDFSRMLAESIPFLKSALGYDSVINLISREGLSIEAYANGTRYGSNSSMYFNNVGYVIVISFSWFLIY